MSQTAGKPRKVLLVDDETFLRALVADLLTDAGYEVQTAAHIDDARKVAREFNPEVLVADINLGTIENGIDLVYAISKQQNLSGIVFLTNVPKPRIIGSDEKSIPKESAYLNKNKLVDPRLLIDAIEATVNKKVPAHLRDDLAENSVIPELSRAQIEVLIMVTNGFSNQQIAEKRDTGLRAVENLLQRAYEVLEIAPDSNSNARVRAANAYLKAAGLIRA